MNSEWKIYTRTGDKGETSLIGGTRVPKYHERIEAYGTLDELNSYLGLIRDQEMDDTMRALLIEIQDRLFTAESLLAADPAKPLRSLPVLQEDDILLLEKEIDRMNENLPELTSFILPGGHPTVSHCHIARCICRRAERLTIKVVENHPETLQGEMVIKYLNRLSDFLFVLSRSFAHQLNAKETPWKARI
ncbi:MAG TPA: cob(I)yrinic acid a,c-diamide adenosyltransferase [Lentimicrobium sp.]|nr:cob(I)yrinic acid a,c-diamide adenosyltransferase [Lentimicrobium sp.]